MDRSEKLTRIVIVDDEELALDYMKRLLGKLQGIHIAGAFTNPLVAKDYILLDNIDIAFLDVRLPEISGIELASQILEHKPHIQIVFVTAYDKYAIQAFELNALDYLLKPVTTERLIKTMNRILKRNDQAASIPEDQPPLLHLQVFQHVVFTLPDQQPTVLQWRTKKAQELFLYLLQNHDQWVRKSALIELLWPEYEEDKAYSLLYTAAYYIRKTIAPYHSFLEISNTNGGYILHTQNVVLDTERWESLLASAPPMNKESIHYYVKIMELYKGDYLQEYDFWWVESERQRLHKMWLTTSLKMAECYRGNSQPEEAVSIYEGICSRHPQAEDAYWGLMKTYADMNKKNLVNKWYDLLSSVLWEELHEKPNEQITNWFIEWQMAHA
ncbi:response regulator receiver protein [Paenibacillus sp. IHB B 3084]|uniref:response regulator n=1 Tax=Paenibacillus sp. IHB B 3084 TaxID=867076 RepID=UPI000721EE03|nr:response regulator [Paenibacillus sp. IHB B 3084]ALP36423.1 response regulator receiver protein [Paenibacillus sp. IHB B 3084]